MIQALSDLIERGRAWLSWRSRLRWRPVVVCGLLLLLLALLLNSAGLALLIASAIVPVALAVELPRWDVYENEPRWGLVAVMIWGWGIGLFTALVGSAIVAALWIDGAPIHAGAAGFGGPAAVAQGRVPIGVLLFAGLLLPAVASILILAGPLTLRQFPPFRNEIMDGVSLGAAAGAAFAAGTAAVAVWPIFAHGVQPAGGVSDWTALGIGLFITRPLIYAAGIALPCAGVWKVMLSPEEESSRIPVLTGLAALIVFTLGDLLTQGTGARAELLWHVLVLAGLGAAFRAATRQAISRDRAMLTGAGFVICSTCQRPTPDGAFCVHCGAPLDQIAVVAPAPRDRDPVDVDVSAPAS